MPHLDGIFHALGNSGLCLWYVVVESIWAKSSSQDRAHPDGLKRHFAEDEVAVVTDRSGGFQPSISNFLQAFRKASVLASQSDALTRFFAKKLIDFLISIVIDVCIRYTTNYYEIFRSLVVASLTLLRPTQVVRALHKKTRKNGVERDFLDESRGANATAGIYPTHTSVNEWPDSELFGNLSDLFLGWGKMMGKVCVW